MRNRGRPPPSIDTQEIEQSTFSPPSHFAEGERARHVPPSHFEEAEERPEPVELAAEIEIEAEMTSWGGLEPTATEPQSFQPQEALDILDEAADEYDEALSEELAETSESSGESATAETDEQRADAAAAVVVGGAAVANDRIRPGRVPPMMNFRRGSRLSKASLALKAKRHLVKVWKRKRLMSATRNREDDRDERRGRHRRRGRRFGREPVRDGQPVMRKNRRR